MMKGILMKTIWSGVLAAVLALCGACSDAADGPKVPDSPKTDAADYRIGDKLAPAVAARAASAAVAGGYKLTTWEDLTPKDWDPMKDVQALSFRMFGDGDPRAQAALDRLKRAWNNAPTNAAMDQQRVRIAGFVVPLEGESDQLREFLLVPYFGACIHVPPPPANQTIHVKLAKPLAGVRTMDALWVSGTIHTAFSDTALGSSGYRMEGDVTEAYRRSR